jgi:hypothetical protein
LPCFVLCLHNKQDGIVDDTSTNAIASGQCAATSAADLAGAKVIARMAPDLK